jgi:carbonic anhydrase
MPATTIMSDRARSALALVVSGALAVACASPTVAPAAAPRSRTPQWSYEGATGPSHWGELSSAFRECSSGPEESPIDLPDPHAVAGPAPVLQYERVTLSLINNGHTVEDFVPSGSVLRIGDAPDDRYELREVHFHSPSEHAFVGRKFDAELHLVHTNRAGAVAVVAVFLVKGRPSDGLAPLIEHLPRAVTREPVRVPGATLDLPRLVAAHAKVLAYRGSLTTPPCTEGVRWFVVEEPLEVSDAQLAALRGALHGPTNRPIQARHGRSVWLLER